MRKYTCLPHKKKRMFFDYFNNIEKWDGGFIDTRLEREAKLDFVLHIGNVVLGSLAVLFLCLVLVVNIFR